MTAEPQHPSPPSSSHTPPPLLLTPFAFSVRIVGGQGRKTKKRSLKERSRMEVENPLSLSLSEEIEENPTEVENSSRSLTKRRLRRGIERRWRIPLVLSLPP